MRAFAAGDAGSLHAALTTGTRGSTWRFIRHRLGRAHEAAADDVMQETWISVARAAPRYVASAPLHDLAVRRGAQPHDRLPARPGPRDPLARSAARRPGHGRGGQHPLGRRIAGGFRARARRARGDPAAGPMHSWPRSRNCPRSSARHSCCRPRPVSSVEEIASLTGVGPETPRPGCVTRKPGCARCCWPSGDRNERHARTIRRPRARLPSPRMPSASPATGRRPPVMRAAVLAAARRMADEARRNASTAETAETASPAAAAAARAAIGAATAPLRQSRRRSRSRPWHPWRPWRPGAVAPAPGGAWRRTSPACRHPRRSPRRHRGRVRSRPSPSWSPRGATARRSTRRATAPVAPAAAPVAATTPVAPPVAPVAPVASPRGAAARRCCGRDCAVTPALRRSLPPSPRRPLASTRHHRRSRTSPHRRPRR
jgi:hypothetical protein